LKKLQERSLIILALIFTIGVTVLFIHKSEEYRADASMDSPVTVNDERFQFVSGTILEMKLTSPALQPSYIRGGQSVRIVPASLIIKVIGEDGKIYVIEAGHGTKQMPETLDVRLKVGYKIRFPTREHGFGREPFAEIFSKNGIGKISSDSISLVP
jgi:argininosuccinate synthase